MSKENALQLLIELISEGDEAQRCYAMQATNKIITNDTETLKIIDVLKDNLYHRDVDVVVDASKSLAIRCKNSNQNEVIKLLTDVALHHPEGDAQIEAIQALIIIAGPTVNKLMSQFALGRPNDDQLGLAEGWDDWWDIQVLAINYLGESHIQGAEAIIEELLLDENNIELEINLLNALALHSEKSFQQLVKHGQSKLTRRRRRVVKAYSKSPYPEAPLATFNSLSDSEVEVRVQALESLQLLGAFQYLTDVLSLINDPQPQIQAQAVKTLLSLSKQLPSGTLYPISNHDLINALTDNNDVGNTAVLQAMQQLQVTLLPAQLDIIRFLLESDNTELVSASAAILSHHQDPQALTIFCQRINDSQLSPLARICLVQNIAKYEDDSVDVLAALNNSLSENDSAFSQVVMHTLVSLEGDAQKLLAAYLLGEEIEVLTEEELARKKKLKMQPIDIAIEEDVQQAPSLDGVLASVSSDYPNTIEKNQLFSANSTLASISADNLMASQKMPDKDTEQHIMEMVDQLPEDYYSYAQVVESNFKASQSSNTNRRKIAKAPRFNYKILAARALGTSAKRRSVKLLLDSLLGSDTKLQTEVMKSLTRIAKVEPNISLLKNVMGPAGTMLVAGDEQLRQACAETLGAINHQASIEVLLTALQDDNINVRISSIFSLGQLISDNALPATENDHVVRDNINKVAILKQIENCLDDSESGVQKMAMQVLANYQVESALEKIIEIAIASDELHTTAANSLRKLTDKNNNSYYLASKVKSLRGMKQTQAINLLGAVLA
jgi:HEAT repeat protein